jgi:dihydrofolate synthase/folylpolyglutamate synthase
MHPHMDYSEAEKYLQGLTDYEKSTSILYNAGNYDLRRMHLLLNALGDPHKGRKTIHIAGTKGKGSTAAMISSILISAGYLTGRFTSPHLFSWQERIADNNRPITKRDFARMTSLVQPHVRTINAEARFGRLTTFEALTAMAFCHFREKKLDFQVLEAGMGGRLDATNVIEEPEVCIITSISLDHTQILGDTLAQIAGEKAGIMKPGCRVISAPQSAEALAVIENKRREINTPLILAGCDISWESRRSTLSRQAFSIQSKLRNYQISLPLLGDYQMENAALAIAAIESLEKTGTKIDCTHIVRGLSNVKWPARLQVLNRTPLLIIDGAHNPYSVNKVIESIKKYFHYKRTFVIFGCSQDKDIEGMAKELSGFADQVILTSSPHPRAATTDYLIPIFQKSGMQVRVTGIVEEALSYALSESGKDDLVLATGSLFLAAAIQKEFNKRSKFI